MEEVTQLRASHEAMEEVTQLRKMTEDFAAQLQSATKALEEREAQLASAMKALEEREAQLANERWQFEEEKQKMAAFTERWPTDIVEVNVGGEVMATERGTLLLAKGTLLEAIFSGRWEESLKRDAAGRVFLDYSPVLFKAILSYLRATRDAKPGGSVASPVVPAEYTAEYEATVRYLDLAEFLGHNSLLSGCPPAALVCSQSTGGTSDGNIRCDAGVLCGGTGRSLRSAVGGARLLGDGGSLEKVAWKVTVRALTGGGRFGAGVIGHASHRDRSYNEPTCWAWFTHEEVYMGGQCTEQHGGWSGWAQGDVAIFQLDVSDGLRMFLRRSGQVYHLQGMPADVMKEARVLLIFYAAGTEVEVSQVTAEDLTEAGF